jgi:UDP-N-acetylmuramyl-tripeptide synthetase
MFFSDINKILTDAEIIGKLPKKKIKFITDHSDQVESSALFVVNKNKNFNQSYLKVAISKGLTTILTNTYFKKFPLVQVIVKDIDKEVLKLLKYRQPYKSKLSVAITGTNGKTSTAWYLAQICNNSKITTKLVGTLGYFKNLKKIKDSKLTTPNNLDLYQFANSNKKNKNYFISEASSHGIHQGRFDNININIAAITNLSHDHLDYHKNFLSYVNTKFLLFTKNLDKNGTAVINYRLNNYNILKKKLKLQNIKIITYGSKDVYFNNNSRLILSILGKKYKIQKLNLNNIQKENLECAIACAITMSISISKIIKLLPSLKSAPGRYEEIKYTKKSSKIIIDYAHTPDALANILKTYSNKNSKPSIVFGCGGERDKSKRKEMAIIANKYANKIYLTDDNPRNENPKNIRKTLKKYCLKGIEITNRRSAIERAISDIDRNEILIIAGKGHEKYQIIKNKKIKFDDYEIAKNFLKRL